MCIVVGGSGVSCCWVTVGCVNLGVSDRWWHGRRESIIFGTRTAKDSVENRRIWVVVVEVGVFFRTRTRCWARGHVHVGSTASARRHQVGFLFEHSKHGLCARLRGVGCDRHADWMPMCGSNGRGWHRVVDVEIGIVKRSVVADSQVRRRVGVGDSRCCCCCC